MHPICSASLAWRLRCACDLAAEKRCALPSIPDRCSATDRSCLLSCQGFCIIAQGSMACCSSVWFAWFSVSLSLLPCGLRHTGHASVFSTTAPEAALCACRVALVVELSAAAGHTNLCWGLQDDDDDGTVLCVASCHVSPPPTSSTPRNMHPFSSPRFVSLKKMLHTFGASSLHLSCGTWHLFFFFAPSMHACFLP